MSSSSSATCNPSLKEQQQELHPPQPSTGRDSEKRRPAFTSSTKYDQQEEHSINNQHHYSFSHHDAWSSKSYSDRQHSAQATAIPHSPCMTHASVSSSLSSSLSTLTASSSFSSTSSLLAVIPFPEDSQTTSMDSDVPPTMLDGTPQQDQYHPQLQLNEHPPEPFSGSSKVTTPTSTFPQTPPDGPTILDDFITGTISTPTTTNNSYQPQQLPQERQQQGLYQSDIMQREDSSSSSSATVSSIPRTPVETPEHEASGAPSYFGRSETAISPTSSSSSSSSCSLASSYAKIGLFWGTLPTQEDTQAVSQPSSSSTVISDLGHHRHDYSTAVPYHRCLWPPESTMITSSTPSTFKCLVSAANQSQSLDHAHHSPPSPKETIPISTTRSRISQAAAERMQPRYLYPNIDSQILFLPSCGACAHGSNCRHKNHHNRNDIHEADPNSVGMSTLGHNSPGCSRSELMWQLRQRNIYEASQPQYLQQQLRALEIQEVKNLQRRRQQDEPTYRERNNELVRRIVQGAVEHGIGEIDLSNRDLDDLPSDIVDLNCAVIQNEQGSLLCNKLQLYLSYNLFTSVPKAIFSLKNLSVLSLRNNHLTELPPEIGLLQNLVELSIGGNQLKYLPWQVTQLSKLVILNVHPNPFLHPPELPSTPGVSSTASGGDTPTTFAMLHDQNLATTQTVRGVGNFATEPLSPPPTPNLTPLSESIQAADEGDEPPFSHAYSSSGVSSSSLSTSANTLPGSGVGRDSSSDSSGGSSSSSSMEQPLPVEELFAIGVERPVVATEESNEAEEVDEEEDHSPPLRAQVRKSKFPSLKVIAGNVLLRSMVKRMTANKSDKGRTSLVAAGKQPSSATPLSPAPPPLVTQESTTTESSKNNKSDNDQKDADEEDEYDSLHQSGADSGSNVGRREREAHSMRRHKKRTHSVSWDMDHHRSQPSRPKAEEQTGVDGPESLSCTMSHPAKDSPLPPPLPRSSASPAVVDRRVVTTSNKVSAGSTCPSKVEAETAMICQRTRMQSALTPYLFEAIDHALTTRLTCPGCNQPIWKSCQRIIVWHEVVGQAMQVPVEYGGCGLATCPGLPPRLLKHVRMCT